MRVFICKVCGRSFRNSEIPKFCYFCGTKSLEEISESESIRIGVNFGNSDYEFPGDVRFDPFTGRRSKLKAGRKLEDFQTEVMRGVFD